MRAEGVLARTAGGSGRRWGRRSLTALDVLVVLLVILYFWLDLRLGRVGAAENWKDRPADRPAQDWLLVGSGGREGLGSDQRHAFATGGEGEPRPDAIMLLHIPARHGKPTLVILPPDLHVGIPGHGNSRHELNAVYAMGGPKLLTRTVENFTWLRIDRYLEVGLVDVVDAVGGVRICTDEPMRDAKAGLDLHAGCHDLTGRQALGYVHAHGPATLDDLDRVERQRSFVGALIGKTMSPRALLNPFRGIPLARNHTHSVTSDNGDHLHNLIRLAFTLRGIGDGGVETATVPMAGFAPAPGAGVVAHWHWGRTRALFAALQADRPVPDSLLIEEIPRQ